MHPVGPLSSKVYWVRRVGLIVLAVAVLLGIVWFLASRTSKSARGTEPLAAVDASAVPTMTGVLAASSASSMPSAGSTSASPSSPVSGSGTAASTSAASTHATGSASADPSASPSASASGGPLAAAQGTATADAVPDPSATHPAQVPGAPESAAQPAAPAAATPPQAAATPPPAAPTPPAAPADAVASGAGPAAGSAAPVAEPAPPSYDAQGRLLCPDADIQVTATTSAPTFAVGEHPRLLLNVTNTGTAACQRDLSGGLQVLTVVSADGTRMWSTADCFPGQGTDIRALQPGQHVPFPVKWSGTTSLPGCVGDRLPAPPGEYAVIAQLGALPPSAPAPFTITG